MRGGHRSTAGLVLGTTSFTDHFVVGVEMIAPRVLIDEGVDGSGLLYEALRARSAFGGASGPRPQPPCAGRTRDGTGDALLSRRPVPGAGGARVFCHVRYVRGRGTNERRPAGSPPGNLRTSMRFLCSTFLKLVEMNQRPVDRPEWLSYFGSFGDDFFGDDDE
jgi:hypothetical protein